MGKERHGHHDIRPAATDARFGPAPAEEVRSHHDARYSGSETERPTDAGTVALHPAHPPIVSEETDDARLRSKSRITPPAAD